MCGKSGDFHSSRQNNIPDMDKLSRGSYFNVYPQPPAISWFLEALYQISPHKGRVFPEAPQVRSALAGGVGWGTFFLQVECMVCS